jgi:hypothetical protein
MFSLRISSLTAAIDEKVSLKSKLCTNTSCMETSLSLNRRDCLNAGSKNLVRVNSISGLVLKSTSRANSLNS